MYRSVPTSRDFGAYSEYKLYRSFYMYMYIDPLKCGTWVLTREWALARDTTSAPLS